MRHHVAFRSILCHCQLVISVIMLLIIIEVLTAYVKANANQKFQPNLAHTNNAVPTHCNALCLCRNRAVHNSAIIHETPAASFASAVVCVTSRTCQSCSGSGSRSVAGSMSLSQLAPLHGVISRYVTLVLITRFNRSGCSYH